VVERLLPPTVRLLAPRKTLPVPSSSIDPAVVPPVVRPEMSSPPEALKMKRAVPPLALSLMVVVPTPVLVMVALPAVLELKKPRVSLLLILALPAVLVSKNF
jgi:hypothetical protein